MVTTVLIVEDEQRSRKLARDILTSAGYRTIEAESGEEGLVLAVQEQPAIILMDIRLPGINGIETMRRIRELPALQHVPILAVTASTMPEEKDELLAAGFSAFLGKPYRFRELMSVVRKALDTTC